MSSPEKKTTDENIRKWGGRYSAPAMKVKDQIQLELGLEYCTK